VRLALGCGLVAAFVLGCGARPQPPPSPGDAPGPVAGPSDAPPVSADAAAAAEAAGRPRTATRLWRSLVERDPADAEARRALVRLAETPQEALPHLQWLATSAAATPADEVAWVDALVATGDSASAVEVARRAAARRPASAALQERALTTRIAAGDAADALLDRPALYARPSGPEHRCAVARALSLAGLEDLAEAEWGAALEAHPDDPGIALAYAEAQLGYRRYDRAAAHLQEACRRHPRSAALAAAYARALEGTGDTDEALTAWATAGTLAPDDPGPADGRARTLLEAGRTEDAIAAWEDAVRRFPDHLEARMHLALALRLRDEPASVVTVLRPLAAIRPEDARAQTALGEALVAAGEAEAIPVLRRALAAGAERRLALPLLARAMAEHGAPEEALALHVEALDADPGNAPLRFSLALFCLRLGDLACGESQLTALLARNPFDARARELLETVLSDHPDKVQRLLLTESYPSAQVDSELAVLASTVTPASGETLGTVLRDEREVTVAGGRVQRLLHRRSILVQRSGGAERYREIAISFNVHRPARVLRARRISPEGVEHALTPAERPVRDPHVGGPLHGDAREQVLIFEALEPGSIVDYEVEVPAPHPESLGAWWDRYVLANVDPTVRARYVLDVPVGETFRAEAPGMGPPTEVESDGRRRLTWERRGLEPTLLAGPTPEAVASVSVASVSDWDGVARWYRALFEPQAVVTPRLAAEARRLVGGAVTRRAQVAAIFGPIEARTTYLGDELGLGAYQPRPAEQTLLRGLGDCKDLTALLAALLRAVGIPAWPALVRPDGPGVFGEDHPTPAQFTHVLLYVPDPQGDFWLDATARLGTVDAVPTVLRGRTALIVDDTGGRVLRIPGSDPARSRLEETLSLSPTPTGGGRMVRTVTARGGVAAEVRQRLLPLPPSDRPALLRSPGLLLGGRHRPGEVRVSGLDDPEGPLTLEATVETPDLVGLRTDGALVVRLDLDALVAPILSGGGGRQLAGRTVARRLRLSPPGGRAALAWSPLRLEEKGRFTHLTVSERRGVRGAATEIEVRLRFESLPAEDAARASWLAEMEHLRAVLDRALVMKPGPGFDPSTLYEALMLERPADPQLAVLYVRALLGRGRLPEALSALDRGLAAHPGSAELARLYFDVLAATEQPVPWSRVDALLAHSASNPEVWLSAGDLAGRSNAQERAENAYRRALALAPQSARALNNLAWLLRDRPGRETEALSLAERAVDAAPEMDAAWDTLAELRFASGDVTGAIAAIDRALALGPERSGLYRSRRVRYEAALRPETGPSRSAPSSR
jgi:tetratricopeptide (TPR) repeat protein/transglutaminase-like putative cysteine protease